MSPDNGITSNPEDEIEDMVDDTVSDKYNNNFNFLINASNQAILTGTYDLSYIQANAIFVLVSPYYISDFSLEGLKLEIKMNEEGRITINGQYFEPFEIQPGIKVFGISKQGGE